MDTPERAFEFEPRMSEAEALMWHLEKDPFLTSSFVSVTLLDRPPDMARLRARMLRASHLVPRLRQRVAPVLGRLVPPAWVEDQDFDIDYHLRRVALPAPGTERQLYDLAAIILAHPFDRTRPLWEFVVVDGLADGRGALVQKMHHTLTDGEGGIRMSASFLDLERDPPDADHAAPLDLPDEPGPAPPGPGQGLRDVVHGTLRIPVAVTRGALGALRRPGDLPAAGLDAVHTAQGLVRQLAVTEAAHSPLWTERSLRRRIETLSVPFDDARHAAKTLGGTLNDLFVTATAMAAGAYHRTRHAPVEDLRASVALSTRKRGTVGGNAFSVARLLVPTDVLDPREAFEAVRERMVAVREARGLAAMDTLAGVVNLLPTPMLVRLARQQVSTVDFATSNVRAAPFDLFLAGSRIEANYPVGPTAGTAFNVTLMSYAGSLDLALNIDTAAVGEPEALSHDLATSFVTLLDAGG